MTATTRRTSAAIPFGVAALTWLAAWLAGNFLAAAAVGATGEETGSVDTPVWVTAISATALWIPMLVALRVVSVREGAGTFRSDYAVAIRPLDLLGVPIGVAAQVALLPLVYWPLERAWPDTFSRDRLEESARTLAASADGAALILLFVVVVIGAPVVEELVYRGLLQGSLARRIDDRLAVFVVAAWFALIHFRPVEYPGLFAFGLVLGACAHSTRRLAMPILTHVAFNATGLAMVVNPVDVTWIPLLSMPG